MSFKKTVVTQKELADLHPAHAVYVYAQNQVSVMSEQLTALKEMARFAKLISKAEDEYLPSGPPMSPLTAILLSPAGHSSMLASGIGRGNHRHHRPWPWVPPSASYDELVRVIGLMQAIENGRLHARGQTERDTDSAPRVRDQQGMPGPLFRRDTAGIGENCGTRACSRHRLPGVMEHVVFTTPYLLVHRGA